MSMSINSPFIFCNIFPQETARCINPLAQSIFVAKSCALTTSAFLAFSNITVQRTMSTFAGGQFLTTINSVDRQLSDGFEHAAKAIGLSLADKAQTPQIVAELKQRGFIDDNLYFTILDSLLTFDGLLSEVYQDGKILIGDFDLMRNILTFFSRIRVNLSQNLALAENRAYDLTSNYSWQNGTTDNSVDYLNYLTSAFSTSSNALILSSNVDFTKSSG